MFLRLPCRCVSCLMLCFQDVPRRLMFRGSGPRFLCMRVTGGKCDVSLALWIEHASGHASESMPFVVLAMCCWESLIGNDSLGTS